MEKSTTKAISLINKINNMLLQRQIVIASAKQIEYIVCAKDAITDFHSIVWIFIAVIVTIYKNAARQRYETSLSIITSKLGSCI